MDLFTVKYETEEDGDLYAISIVDSPANGFDFITMSETKVEIRLSSDPVKKILYGIVLRPDQKIYREMPDGTPFQLMFEAQVIERLSQDFMRKGYQGNSTFNHNDNNWLNGTTVVENWIVQSSTNDKGNAIGLPVQNGDWCIGMKLSDDLWSEYIETGLAKGFSIDSFVKFEKINMNTVDSSKLDELEMSEKNKTNNMSMLKKLIKMFSEESVNLASVDTLELGTLTADAFEIGNIVYDANLAPVVDMEFTVNNIVYSTDATGVIVEISAVSEETADQEAQAGPEAQVGPMANDMEAIEMTETTVEVKEIVEVETSEDASIIEEKIKELMETVSELKETNMSLVKEVEELKSVKVDTKLRNKAIITTTKNQESALDVISRITKNNK